MPDVNENIQAMPEPEEAGEHPQEKAALAGDDAGDDRDAAVDAETPPSETASGETEDETEDESAEASGEMSSEAASDAANAASGASSSSTSGGSARGIDEHAIDKWTPEQQKVFNSVKDKVQELGIGKDDVERIAAFSVLRFIQEKDRKPDTRVDRVQAVNANGDTIVRMENMKYGDREPIFTNDVRMKDTPAFDQSAAQIEQANQRVHQKSAADQQIAQQQQNQDASEREKSNVLQKAEDQIMSRAHLATPILSR